MSVVESPSFTVAIDCLRRRFDRNSEITFARIVPSKRKLDEFLSAVVPGDGALSVRMRKLSTSDASSLRGVSYGGARQEDDEDRLSTSCSSDNATSGAMGNTAVSCSGSLQFFVRDSSRTMVIRARPEDTVELVHFRIMEMTGIPASEQRLIFNGRQLFLDRTLAQCGVQKDSCLQLTGRLRSTERPGSWMVVNEIISGAFSLINAQKYASGECPRVDILVRVFLEMIPKIDTEKAKDHLNVFLISGAPAALVILYARSRLGSSRKLQAEKSIQYFLNSQSDLFPRYMHVLCLPIVLEFCKLLLSGVSKKDTLYISCRKALSSLLGSKGLLEDFHLIDWRRPLVFIQEIFPFVQELSSSLSGNLSKWILTDFCPEKFSLIAEPLQEFSNFLDPLNDQWDQLGPFPVPLSEGSSQPLNDDWFRSLHAIFMELLEVVDRCLKETPSFANIDEEPSDEIKGTEMTIIVSLLSRLNDLSKIFEGAEEILHSVLLGHRVALNALIRRTSCVSSLWWTVKHRGLTDFESRRHLVMLMFSGEKDDFGELHEMLIDRSSVLSESFEYIITADPLSLRGGLFMEFKNEEATGPGVLREWFCLLCREIFNQKNVLFLTCPRDRHRFLPNPASAVDPLHANYFLFCGRVIALALMHNVQAGITFDRTFFLNLSGKDVSLEDVQDTDPVLFSSCKKILEMDKEILDSDILGLTFVRDVEYLGSRRTVELCHGGKDIMVNSTNRKDYVNLMIQHCFVTSVSEQVKHFLRGFSDILMDPTFGKRFFSSLDLEDLDRMLCGNNGIICTMDWKKHTEYKGYKATDHVIYWFWKVVGCMSTDQQRALLFFWTSVKFLPAQGFSGLECKLEIYQSSSSIDHLPTAHTCFYRLCLPPYTSFSMMTNRLLILTQEHVGCSFGVS